MSDIKITIAEGFNSNNAFTTNRSYQHMTIVGNKRKTSKIMEVTPSFISSITCLSDTIKTLCLRNVQILSDLFIRSISNLVNLKELRLEGVRCSDNSFRQVNEELNTPQLDHLYIYECPNGELISALSKIETQSKQIEFSFEHDLSNEFLYLLNNQKCLESLIILRLREEDRDESEDLDFFLEGMVHDHIVTHKNLRRLVIYDEESTVNLQLSTGFANFLTLSANNLRELDLCTIDHQLVEVMANEMKIETLCYRETDDISWRRVRVDAPNNFLKKIVNNSESGCEVSELLSIFPSVETLVSLYEPDMMNAFQNMNSLKNLSLECGNNRPTKIQELPLPTVRTVDFYLKDFVHMKHFLENNCSTIDTLIVKHFRVRSEGFAGYPPTNVILEFFSKFKRVVLIHVPLNRLEIFNIYDTARYQSKVFEVESKTFWKAYRKLGATSNVLRLLKCTPLAKIRKLQEIFEMNCRSSREGCLPKESPEDSDFSDGSSIDVESECDMNL